jgi:XTP/dITP diphosphohydrolase
MASQPAGNTPMERLVDAMTQIRDRCVWTQAIDHDALVPYLIEESFELVEAIETGTRTELIEELGDVLWQVLFHAEIASRAGTEPFDLNDVAQAALDKMVPRHPHVFGDDVATTPEEVMTLWFRAKAAEKSTRTSVLDGIPRGMPALALADKVLSRAGKVGVTVDGAHPERGRVGDAHRESSGDADVDLTVAAHREPSGDADVGPTAEADPDVNADADPGSNADAEPDSNTGADPDSNADADAELELGRRLLAEVQEARGAGLDAERALRRAIRELEGDVRTAESVSVAS